MLLLLTPLIVVGAVVGAYTWISLHSGVSGIERLNQLESLALETQIHVSEMGSAVRGFLLDPSSKEERARKEAADEANAAALKQMRTLSRDSQVISLIDEMAQFDEVQLNAAENEVMSHLEAQQVNEARTSFIRNYLPLRERYDSLSKKLLTLARSEVKAGTQEINADLRQAALRIIFLLVGGVLLTLALFVFNISKIGRTLEAVAESLGQSESNLNGASDQLAENSVLLSGGATQAAASLQQTSSAVHEITITSQRSLEGAESAARFSAQNHEEASRGRDAVSRMSQAIEEIEQSTGTIERSFEEANSRMREIAAVISGIAEKTAVINEIVFQTKLLSFNASVEAARAGEHGKGFAVVAEEVGNLAQMSGAAANEITTMILESRKRVDSIVDDSTRTISALIQTSREKVAAGSMISQECANALEQIVSGAEQAGRFAQDAARSVHEQSLGIKEISDSIHHVESSVGQAAQSARVSADYSKELKDQAQTLSTSVRHLRGVVHGAKAA
jgi:methyl-accepting chemotaxis protein